MAQVDFSNAVLDVNSNTIINPMNAPGYMDLGYADSYAFQDSNGNQLNLGSARVLTSTPAKVSVLFSGTFNSNVSGTEFYMGYYNQRPWKVSNISFSGEDTYAFVIDIEASGNT